jgi:hypothetical protein
LPDLLICRLEAPFAARLAAMTGLLIVGAIAGFVCGGLFNKPRDKAVDPRSQHGAEGPAHPAG